MATNEIDNDALHKRFNPEGSDLRRMQMRMLDILIEIDKVCKRHNIRYWLSSGTLIGAIRHDGFIAWDDDLDIEMMREDYLRLMKVLPTELPEWLALQDNNTDPNYFYFYAKVRDRHSRIEENNAYDRHFKEKGIFVDIFPLEKQPKWIHILSEKTFGHAYKIWRTSKDDAKSMKCVRRFFNINNRLIYPLLRLMCRLSGCKTITSGLGIPFHNPRFEQDIFPLTTHIFEGRAFPVPDDSDHLLRCIYGDYMQLPDIGNITPHTLTIKFDVETEQTIPHYETTL